MNVLRRVVGSLLVLAFAAALAGCCSDCIKDPPCCPKAKAPAAEKAK